MVSSQDPYFFFLLVIDQGLFKRHNKTLTTPPSHLCQVDDLLLTEEEMRDILCIMYFTPFLLFNLHSSLNAAVVLEEQEEYILTLSYSASYSQGKYHFLQHFFNCAKLMLYESDYVNQIVVFH